MKGISTILALILIVIIVVALIGLTYTFAVGLFGTVTEGATEQTEATTERMSKSITIVGSSCEGFSGTNREYKFTLKSTGTEPVLATELGALLDGAAITVTFADIPSGQLDTEKTATNTTVSQGEAGDHTLTISAPAAEVTDTFTCE